MVSLQTLREPDSYVHECRSSIEAIADAFTHIYGDDVPNPTQQYRRSHLRSLLALRALRKLVALFPECQLGDGVCSALAVLLCLPSARYAAASQSSVRKLGGRGVRLRGTLAAATGSGSPSLASGSVPPSPPLPALHFTPPPSPLYIPPRLDSPFSPVYPLVCILLRRLLCPSLRLVHFRQSPRCTRSISSRCGVLTTGNRGGHYWALHCGG